jgi:alkanesulfonate monooxygenase SsuD/methylene tetrahydromethanopterin reductase-like flavin-dependent oxidoreductase (luciferase family)
VNNFRAFVCFPLLALIAVFGCEKANDVPRLKDEAMATAKNYQQRFDELAHRAEALSQRGSALPPDTLNSANAQRIYRQAQSRLEDYRRSLQQAPTSVEAGVKSGNPEELHKLIASLHERFGDGVVETTAQLSAVESWIATAEHRQPAPRVAPAQPAPEPVTDDASPVSPGSAAPVR